MIEFNEIKKIVEALIFASDTPITENRVKNVVMELDSAQINDIVNELNNEYDRDGHAFKIARLAGGFQFVAAYPA